MPDDASDFLRQQVTLDPSKLKAALDAALADGYTAGSLAAVTSITNPTDLGVAALFGPDPKKAWDQWKPGNVDASQLLDNGGFKDLLSASDVTIKGIGDTMLDRMGSMLADGAAKGRSVDEIADDLYGVLNDTKRSFMVADTELARATEAASLDRYSANGIKRWEWVLSPEACPLCVDEADKGLHTLDDEPPPHHPYCRCASSPVDLPDETLPLDQEIVGKWDDSAGLEDNIFALRNGGNSWPDIARLAAERDAIAALPTKAEDENAYWREIDKLDRLYKKTCKERGVDPYRATRKKVEQQVEAKVEAKVAEPAELFPDLPKLKEPQTYYRAATETNPMRGDNFRNNCHYCAPTMEMRARGYDVTAAQTFNSQGRFFFQSAQDWRDSAGNVREFTLVNLHQPGKTTFGAVSAAAADWPDGARGFISVTWKQGGGHIYNCYKDGNVLRFVDGQVNSTDASAYLNRVSDVRILRVDDLAPVPSRISRTVVSKAVPVTQETQRKAGQELLDTYNEDLYAIRNAGWQNALRLQMFRVQDNLKKLGKGWPSK